MGLVCLAPPAPVPGPHLPLPAPRLPAHISAVAVPVRLRLRPPSETADLRKYRKRSNWAQAYAGTRGQDRPTTATRCAKVRPT